MKYNFSTIIDRSNTSAIKLERLSSIFGNAQALSMWVADMDFATPPFIINRLKQRLDHPILGYTDADNEYNNAIVGWLSNRHGWEVQPSWLSFAPGIVAGLNHAVQAYTQPDEKVLVQTPVYHPFFYAINNNGRELVKSPLTYNKNFYSINFYALEEEMKKGVKLFILCNPHNPVGRVWTRDELTKMAEICLKYDVTVISDEIHADLIFKPHKHISFASLSPQIAEKTITFGSASKTFNIAGLTSAYVVISNPDMLKTYNRQVELNGTGHGNIMGYEALKAAYSSDGQIWLDQVLEYIGENIKLVKEYLGANIPKLTMVDPEGTYLLWLDFRAFGVDQPELIRMLTRDAGIALNDGQMFGSDGTGFFRMNVATPKSNVQEALERLKKVFGSL
ncbi:MAG: PatB family C-S lyase [Bacteroidales bacterium]|jgi:cystathionine beta-lyase|nr:PatB family C-S lyase [Bacteroidales bacterium]MDD4385214.1 PatB family C-S lyase [Bacteroidales bacterium]MDY0198219.1 PatB family C-S lyase [Tenuifilaceae bacterium]